VARARTTDASVKIAGLSKLRRALRDMQGDAEDLKEANARAAAIVAARATATAPRRTGRLAGSVRGNRAVSRAQIAAGGATVPYAGPIHWGWPARGITAQPFVSDAAVDTEPIWLPQYQADLDRAVAKVGGTYR